MPARNAFAMLQPMNTEQLQRLQRVVELLHTEPVPWHETISGIHISLTEPMDDVLPRAALLLLYDTYRVWSIQQPRWDELVEIDKALTESTVKEMDHETVLDLLAMMARTDYWIDGSWEKYIASDEAKWLFARLLEHESVIAANPLEG